MAKKKGAGGSGGKTVHVKSYVRSKPKRKPRPAKKTSKSTGQLKLF